MLLSRLFAPAGAVTAAACGALLAACAGADLSLLDEPPGGSSSSSDASVPVTTPDGSASHPTPPPSHDSGAPHDASAPQDSAPPPPPPDDSGGGDDSATGEDSASGKDSGPPSTTSIPCGKKTCDPTSKVCCVTMDNNGDQTFTCESANDCDNSGGLSVPCVSAADCATAGSPVGSVCCVTEGDQSSPPTVACVPTTSCLDPSSQAWMCDPSDPVCPLGDTCKVSTQTIPPYSICVAP
jgi:hypothetical protein